MDNQLSAGLCAIIIKINKAKVTLEVNSWMRSLKFAHDLHNEMNVCGRSRLCFTFTELY